MLIITEEYISPSECKQIVDTYNEKLAANVIHPRGTKNTDIALDKVSHMTTEIVETVEHFVSQQYGIHNLTLDYCAYTRVYPGSYHELHADAFKLDGSPNHTPDRVMTAMIYLSDGTKDFSNGILHFPALGVRVQPRPGLLVTFPTTLQYQHEVTVVTGGVRDSIAIWFN